MREDATCNIAGNCERSNNVILYARSQSCVRQKMRKQVRIYASGMVRFQQITLRGNETIAREVATLSIFEKEQNFNSLLVQVVYSLSSLK